MFQINLVPEIQEEKNKLFKLKSIVFLVCFIIIVAVLAILLIVQAITLNNKRLARKTDQNIAQKKQEIAQYKNLEEAVISLQDGLEGAKQILSGKNSWVTLLEHLEKATPAEVKFTSLSLESGKIEANLEGRDVYSVGRMEESFKNYQIIRLSGFANTGSIKVSIDSSEPKEIKTRLDNSWSYALGFDPNTNHEIKIDVAGSESTILNYNAEQKSISGPGNINAEIRKLFKAVEMPGYEKQGNRVLFSAKISFDKGALW